jgi:hypothetical protein
MDDKFYRGRARLLRAANEADPFIKKRLLHLANNYDDMGEPRQHMIKGPEQSYYIDSRRDRN